MIKDQIGIEEMGTIVKIAPILQEHSHVPGMVEVRGNTVGECLDDLIRQYPEIRSWFFDHNDLLRVLISVNNEETFALDTNSNLDRTLNPADEIRILAIVSGG